VKRLIVVLMLIFLSFSFSTAAAERYGLYFEADLNKLIFESGDQLEVSMLLINSYEEKKLLEFSSSKLYEITITNRAGDIVYKWSDDMVFTQAFQEMSLEAGGIMEFSESTLLSDYEPGIYFLRTEFLAEEHNRSSESIFFVKTRSKLL